MRRNYSKNTSLRAHVVEVAVSLDDDIIDKVKDIMEGVPADGILVYRLSMRNDDRERFSTRYFDTTCTCTRRCDCENYVPFLIQWKNGEKSLGLDSYPFVITELTPDAIQLKLKNSCEGSIYYTTLRDLSMVSAALAALGEDAVRSVGDVKFNPLNFPNKNRDQLDPESESA